jgi:hypothetical protein
MKLLRPALLFAPLLIGSTALADEATPSCLEGGTCAIDDLKTPTSPSFILIGASPTLVERPTTPQDVAVTVYNAVKQAGGLPRDFALEVAPYWLLRHPRLTYAEYTHAGLFTQLLQNATVSLATATTDATAAAAGFTDLGLGLRTHVFINMTSDEKDVLEAEDKAAKSIRPRNVAAAEQEVLRLQMINNIEWEMDDLGCAARPTEGRCPSLDKELQELKGAHPVSDDIDKQLAIAAKNLQDALAARAGVVVSLAAAVAGRTPAGHKLSWKEPRKEAVWLNFGGVWPRADLLGVARYIHVKDAGSLAFFDLGARASMNWRNYALFVEYLRRFVPSKPAGSTVEASNRLAGTLEVAVRDGIYLSATFGQDAATEDKPSGLLTLLGVSFQASRERTLAPR